jgi:Raf kinase inhibitor-like YbhB/YbcL family protein
MKITSCFVDNENIPKVYTCEGDNINPPFEISEIPENTKSLVLIMHDPDSPSGDFLHWLVYNISPDTNSILEDYSFNNAIVGKNDFDNFTYDGPCPPTGVHRYIFDLFALSEILDLDDSASFGDIQKAMKDKIIETSRLIGKYGKS